MRLPKLYQNLKKLPAKVLTRFTKYLESPFFNQHSETLELWQALCRFAPDYAVDDETLFQAAFPEKKYDNARLRVLRTYLFEHLEAFLIQQELNEAQGLKHRLLRKAVSRYEIEFSSPAAWESQTSPPYFAAEEALSEFLLREDLFAHSIKTRNFDAARDKASVAIPLDVYYLTLRLKFLCAQINPNLRRGEKEETPAGLNSILSLVDELNLLHEPLIALYYHLLKIFQGQETEKNLALCRQTLASHGPQMDSVEQINGYAFLLSIYQKRMLAKMEGASQQLFELYQEMAGIEIIFDQGDFSAIHFRNTVEAAAKVKEFTWGFTFIAQKGKLLDADRQAGVIAYCKAFLFFGMKKFSEAKRELLGVEFYDSASRVSRQMLLFRVYYEENDLQGVESVGQALKMYLNRSVDLPDLKQTSMRNLLRFATRLFHLKGKNSPQAEAEKILNEIKACDSVANPEWLFEKAAEIMKKNERRG